MPRRNGKAHKPRMKKRELARNPHKKAAKAAGKRGWREPTEHLVVPDGRCGRKLSYFDETKAAKALAQAQARRRALGQDNEEKRYYRCDLETPQIHFHLTSRDEYHPKEPTS